MAHVQDLTEYTVVDTGYLSITSSDISVDDVTENVDAYAYKDFGAGYFTGTLSFKLDVKCTDPGPGIVDDGTADIIAEQTGRILTESGNPLIGEDATPTYYRLGGECSLWVLSNNIDDAYALESSSYNHLRVDWVPGAVSGTSVLSLVECYGGVKYQDTHVINAVQDYYIRISINNSVLSCKVYSDALLNTLGFELELSLHSATAYRYLMPFSSKNTGELLRSWSGVVGDLAFYRDVPEMPVRTCRECFATWVEDDRMYEEPYRCPRCGAYPESIRVHGYELPYV